LNKVDVSHLSDEQKTQLLTLLRKHKDVFNDRAGLCNLGEAALPVKPDFEFRTERPYRIPGKLRPEADRQTAELLAEGKIQPCYSSFAHPVVMVAKKTTSESKIPTSWRLAVDYRILNEGLVKSGYPVPRTDDLLEKIAPAKFLTTLDCSNGFWGIKLKEEDQYKTAFIVGDKQYKFLVLAFGIMTASQIYQKFMHEALKECTSYAFCYIDDTCVSTMVDDFAVHLDQLDNVLTAFKTAGFTLKLAKARFCRREINFIGFTVGQGKKKAQLDKLEAIKRIPIPTTKKAVRAFLGCISFYSILTPNKAKLALPLTELTRKSVPAKLKLNEAEIKAFNQLKEELMKATELYTPDYRKPFQLFVDSSQHTVAACLAQKDENDELKPIAFTSKKLNDVESRWDITNKEAYSVVVAVKTFEHILFNCKIDVHSDHDCLKWMLTKTPPSAKMVRWRLYLSRLDISVQYIPGYRNAAADFLTRYME
jgi:RNase H-like domain found in reverse transcriptase/Reverse transcriptase (RNA-dependent DNA polymerase)